MAESAALLVDEVFPEHPVRQGVLSFPYRRTTANVAWIFGLHDRPWQERPVFGKVRSMTAGCLDRKFDIEGYVRWVESLDWIPQALTHQHRFVGPVPRVRTIQPLA